MGRQAARRSPSHCRQCESTAGSRPPDRDVLRSREVYGYGVRSAVGHAPPRFQICPTPEACRGSATIRGVFMVSCRRRRVRSDSRLKWELPASSFFDRTRHPIAEQTESFTQCVVGRCFFRRRPIPLTAIRPIDQKMAEPGSGTGLTVAGSNV